MLRYTKTGLYSGIPNFEGSFSKDRDLPSDGCDTIEIHRYDRDSFLRPQLDQNASPWIRHKRMTVCMVAEIKITSGADPHHEQLVVDSTRPEQQFPTLTV